MVFVAGDVAWANPLDEFGFGARAISLGGAVTAVADDFSANYYNPAAVAASDWLRLEFGYTSQRPSLAINGHDQEVDASEGFQGGLLVPGNVLGRRVGASVGIHLPEARVTRLRALPERRPRWVLYDNRPQRLVIAASVGFEVVEDLFVGGSLTFLTSTKGSVDIRGQVGILDEEKTVLLGGVDVRLPAVRYAGAGVLWTPGRWRFGLSFRDEFKLEIDLSVLVTADLAETPQEEEATLRIRSRNVNLFSPRQYSAGVAYDGAGWLVSVDLQYLQWSLFPSPTARVEVALDIPGLPLTLPPVAHPGPPGFRDIVVVRTGAEYRVVSSRHLGVDLRAGYFFAPSPAPDQPGVTNFVDSDKHGISGGLGFELNSVTDVFPGPVILDLAVQVIVLEPRTYRKDDPADPVGDYRGAGHTLGGAVTCKFLF
jgi:long-chain fatty acid transport protein